MFSSPFCLGHNKDTEAFSNLPKATQKQDLTPGCLTVEPMLANTPLNHFLVPADWQRLTCCLLCPRPLLPSLASHDGLPHFLTGPGSVIGLMNNRLGWEQRSHVKRKHTCLPFPSCTVLCFSWYFPCYIMECYTNVSAMSFLSKMNKRMRHFVFLCSLVAPMLRICA